MAQTEIESSRAPFSLARRIPRALPVTLLGSAKVGLWILFSPNRNFRRIHRMRGRPAHCPKPPILRPSAAGSSVTAALFFLFVIGRRWHSHAPVWIDDQNLC